MNPHRSIDQVRDGCLQLVEFEPHIACRWLLGAATGDCGWASSRTRTTRASGDPHRLDPWSGGGRAPPCDRDTPGDCDRDTASKSSPATPPLALPRTGTSPTGAGASGSRSRTRAESAWSAEVRILSVCPLFVPSSIASELGN